MKAKIIGMTLLVAGMLAASPAHASSSFCLGTYYLRHGFTPQSTCPARPEVQVAVMASTELKAQCPTVSVWYGTGANARATHSH